MPHTQQVICPGPGQADNPVSEWLEPAGKELREADKSLGKAGVFLASPEKKEKK